MTTTTIHLPESVQKLADARIASGEFSSFEEYVESLILADATGPIGPELESHLLRALQTPGKVMTSVDWDEKRRRLIEANGSGRQ